jgi:TolA-binding protein
MARRITRKSLKQDEFVEAAFDVGVWLERHWKSVVLGIAAVAALAAIGLAWSFWIRARARATSEIFDQGYDLYQEAGGVAPAPAQTPGPARLEDAVGRFQDAARRGGGTPLGEVAVLYEGLARMRAGAPAEAGPRFEEVAQRASNPVLKSTAKANLAEALAASGDVDRAIATWTELSEAEPAYYPADHAALHVAKLMIGAGRTSEAAGVLRDLVADYPQTSSAAAGQELLDQIGGQ